MSIVFRFRMLSDENDNFVRDYDVKSENTLLDLHNFILQSLEYEECIASFFTADKFWEKLHEFTLMDMADSNETPSRQMDSVTLGEIVHSNSNRLIYLFDMFNDRAYFLELTNAYEVAEGGAAYPREVYAQAEVPDQYDAAKHSVEGGGSLFDDIMGDFNEFDGNDCYDDE